MKRITILFLLITSFVLNVMAQTSLWVEADTISSSGVTFTRAPYELADIVHLTPLAGTVTLSANVAFNISSAPSKGQHVKFEWESGFILNGHTFGLNGISINQSMLNNPGSITLAFIDNVGTYSSIYTPSFNIDKVIPGSVINDSSVALIKIGPGQDAQIPICATATGAPTYRTVGGQATLSDIGLLTLDTGVITDVTIATGANIKRQKLASGTANYVQINNPSGYASEEQRLAPSRGGTGIDASSSTGVLTYSSGTATIGAIAELIRVEISFDTLRQGYYYVHFPYACTITQANIRVTENMSTSDTAKLAFANGISTYMTGSNLSGGKLVIGTPGIIGDGYSTTLTSNNTFTAGQEMQIISSRPVYKGAVSVDISLTRTQ